MRVGKRREKTQGRTEQKERTDRAVAAEYLSKKKERKTEGATVERQETKLKKGKRSWRLSEKIGEASVSMIGEEKSFQPPQQPSQLHPLPAQTPPQAISPSCH